VKKWFIDLKIEIINTIKRKKKSLNESFFIDFIFFDKNNLSKNSDFIHLLIIAIILMREISAQFIP
jgi:hypothetical protein